MSTHGRRAVPESALQASNTIPGEVARRLKLVVFDVDGVLTDAGVYIGETASGEAVELKRFNIQDGLGLKLLEMGGLKVVMVSGRVSPATTIRGVELKIDVYQDGGAEKVRHVRKILAEEGFAWNEVAMLSDDLPDLALLRRVGLKAAVANAVPEVLEEADWVARAQGGHGAAREFCQALLQARGQWEQVVEDYVSARSDAEGDVEPAQDGGQGMGGEGR